MLQNFNINVVIICEWKGLGVHFLTANGEDYIYSKNSDTSVILLFEVQQGGGHRHQGRHHSRQAFHRPRSGTTRSANHT